MRLTYIFHSGFVLETEKSILIFDYWMNPVNVMESILQSKKPLYILSSHFHEDTSQEKSSSGKSIKRILPIF